MQYHPRMARVGSSNGDNGRLGSKLGHDSQTWLLLGDDNHRGSFPRLKALWLDYQTLGKA